MTVWLVITRAGVRVVKRQPYPTPGEWVARLDIEFPSLTPPHELVLTLPPEPELAALHLHAAHAPPEEPEFE